MNARSVLWIVVFAAVLVMRVAPSLAFIAQPALDPNLDFTVEEAFGQSPMSYQYRVADALRYGITSDSGLPWTFVLRYDDFSIGDEDGKAWTAVGAYKQSYEDFMWGIKMVEEYWDVDDFDSVLYEGVAPYFSYKKDYLTVGGYVVGAYAFSDEPEVEETFSFGIGGAGSYKFNLAEGWTLVPRVGFQYYDSGQEGWEESFSITTDIGLKFDLSEKLTLGFTFDYTMETADDVVDANWYGLGLNISTTFNENAGGFAGIKVTEGFDTPGGEELDNTTFTFGVRLQF